MKLFDRFKRLIACIILTAFIPSQAWAQGIIVPAGSTLNVNSGQLSVPGDVNNSGTLTATTGTINLTGDWINAGKFTPGNGLVNFNAASGNQNVGIGTFWNMSHTAASTVKLNNPVFIDNNFSNTAGTFNANAQYMSVNGNWQNTAGINAFTASGNTVNFKGANGSNQFILGSTTFYNFIKRVTAPSTVTFDSAGSQVVTNNLTMEGASGNNLSVRSTSAGTQASLILSNTGGMIQSINYVDVMDSNASGGKTLIGENATPASSTQNNLNWMFNNNITWTGSKSSNWQVSGNWFPEVVPDPTSTVTIPASAVNQPNLCPSPPFKYKPCAAVTVSNLIIGSSAAPNASLTLSGQNLTVSNTFTNYGTVYLNGSETITLTQDTAHSGIFEYLGTGNGSNDTLISSYANLLINDTHGTRDTFITAPSTNLTAANNVTVTSGTLDIAKNSDTLTVGGTLSVNGANGVITAYNGTTSGNITANGAVTITAGSFTPPGANSSFTVSGNFTNTAGVAAFNTTPGKGTVTLNGGNQSVIGSTTFYNFVKSAPSAETLTFDHTGTQTFTNGLTLRGAGSGTAQLLTINSDSSGHAAAIVLSQTGSQSIGFVYVQDSNAGTPPAQQTLIGFNGGQPAVNPNNTNWLFEPLAISVPGTGTTAGQKPTIIGDGPANSSITIKGIVGGVSTVVATVTTDANGNFRVAASSALDIGANSLTPYVSSYPNSPGSGTNFTVTATPTLAQVPNISSINGNAVVNPNASQFISGSKPTIAGQSGVSQNGQVVTILANIYQGANLVLETVGTGVVAAGQYSITVTTPLPAATNYLSVTIGGVASGIIQVALANPFGYVYNSVTNQTVQGATITLYNAATNQIASPAGLESCTMAGTCCDMSGNCCTSGVCTANNPPGNPFTTGADGFYGFLAPAGSYYFKISAMGYTYPSKVTVIPPGRSIGTGSEGQTFPVGTNIVELDQPVDGNATLLHIVKTANKSEASVGDIVMYTVNIQNLSSTNPVTNVVLNDEIPPGFKYVKNRVLLGGTPIAEPSGQRPLDFTIGTVAPGATQVLQYQLVIGSGVTMGNYKNTANAQYPQGLVISNPSQASVRIIPDPVFDLGTVIGKVFFDWNENGIQDPPFFDPVSHETIIEKPVPNVQIVMEDGTVITTDSNGQYSIPGLLPGRHLFRLDERTLPPGAYLTTDKAVIVDVTAGSISKVNFGVNIDESQTKSRDAVFFNEKIRLTQGRDRPVPRLNAALFNASAQADPKTEEVVLHEGALVRQAEFRIFTNYWPFINSWRLEILDADTRKLVRHFEGTALNINDPIYWNGMDDQDVIINPDHKYSYVLTVTGNNGNSDNTKEKPITVRQVKDDAALKKERDESKDVLKDRADRYRKWLDAQTSVNNINHQLIPIQGETINLDRQGTDVKSIHVMKNGHLFTDLPLSQRYGLTPDELMAGGFSRADEKDNVEIILPNGDYTLDVVSVKSPDANSAQPPAQELDEVPDQNLKAASGLPSRTLSAPSPGSLEHYSRPLQVGDDYILFVALGDAQVGYNIDRGNIEPIQDPTQQPGLYHEGKAAYYLKGQILGKYLITSSYDSDRAEKAMFRQLDPNVYYPVYGDSSSVNYDAADTQGALYLKVEWDKSSAILGNYAVDFNDTDFAAFSQKYYGGKLDYQSVATNPYGDARTKLVVYHAQVQQLPSHNEFLATGGSLYFLKYKNVIQGSDTVTLQVRDQTSGLVVATQTLTNGADYELDAANGTILFWQPVAMIAQSESIISNNLINGDPIYVVVDYQFAASGLQTQASQGARVAQSVGNNLVLGGTYVQDNSGGQNYNLQGTDATLHVDKDTTIKAEYAQTVSQQEGDYVSTDGGITFAALQVNNTASGHAYGIKGDTRLFDNIGVKTYYKWIGNDFGATDTSSQQGSEKMGMTMTWDLTPVTRITASEDVQKLLAQNNIQTSTQIGASETDTTMLQVVHTAERLKLTGQVQLVQTRSVINGVESTTNQKGATFAGQAQYDLTSRIKLTLGQQVDVTNPNNTATTFAVADRLTDHFTLNAQDVVSPQGSALTGGVTNQITPKIALTTDYTLTNLNTGVVDKTVGIGVVDKISKNITTTGSVAMTSSSQGATTTTASIATVAKISDNATVNVSLGKTQQGGLGAQGQAQQASNISLNGTTQIGNTTVTGTAQANGGIGAGSSIGTNTTPGTDVTGSPLSNPVNLGVPTVNASSSVGVQAVTKVDNNNTTNGSINVANDLTGVKTTTFGFGNTSKLDQELQAVTDNSFSFAPGGSATDSSKYGLVSTSPGGQKLEGDYTRMENSQPSTISQSNIYGLSGDVNDKLALNGSVQRGKVQNLGAGQTFITDFSLGSGYVLKDPGSTQANLKNSIKLELRLDKGSGTDTLHQYVFYDALQGKLNDNTTANIKVDYSKTMDITSGATAERHEEIILGMAYRPVNFDNLNLITEYSYQEGYGGGLQQADALNTNVNQTVAQVFSGEAVYDINDKWQAAEKVAYRIMSEQDTGFAFTQTHTWLVIHRLNYKIDKDWTISGELRDLAQVEAKDNNAGLLLQVTRDVNQNTELSIGWNFTKFSDDLTNLSYTTMGPFVRMTGKFYDETPQEKARAKAKWLDAKIDIWAWEMIRRELGKKDSKIVLELNRMFLMAKKAQKSGRLEESRQIYKDIISAGQIMYDEASEYIRAHVVFEEKLQQDDKNAREYFKGGEYVRARKIWEKVVEDASKGVIN